MIYSEEEYPQGSDEWLQMKAGKLSASKVTDVLAKLKSGQPAASRTTYMWQLIAERLTGVKSESHSNAAMKWGIETEPQARAAYEFTKDVEVKQFAFIDHPHIELAGMSPDGEACETGGLEIKCPNTSTHGEFLITKKIPKKYNDQMMWQMACRPQWEWVDYMSFDPRMPEHLNKLIIRVDRDDKYIQEMEMEVIKFNKEIDDKLKILENL